MIQNLYYADTNNVQEVPYTRDRALSVAPIFHHTRKAALIAVKARLAEEVQVRVMRIMELEREIVNENL